jgi:hypothetical protein
MMAARRTLLGSVRTNRCETIMHTWVAIASVPVGSSVMRLSRTALVLLLLGRSTTTAQAQPQCLYRPDAKGHVEIPNNVTSIGDYAFSECTSLVTISIPSSVTSIGDFAFLVCTSLATVDLPNSVTSIGKGAFSVCTSLVTVSIPSSVTSIGDFAFQACTSLATVDLPNSITSIGKGAFLGCISLVTVGIPSSVTSIGILAFPGSCLGFGLQLANNASNNLRGVVRCIPCNTPRLTIPGNVTSIGEDAFYGCTAITTVNLPSNVTSIGILAFEGCTSLATVSIPSSVTSIGDSAFEGCTSLATVNLPRSVTSIGDGAFSTCACAEGEYVPGAQLLNCTDASTGNYSCIAPSGCVPTKPGIINYSKSFIGCLEEYTSTQGCPSRAPTPGPPSPPRPAPSAVTLAAVSIGGTVAVAMVLGFVWLKARHPRRHGRTGSIAVYNVNVDALTETVEATTAEDEPSTGNASHKRVFCHIIVWRTRKVGDF